MYPFRVVFKRVVPVRRQQQRPVQIDNPMRSASAFIRKASVRPPVLSSLMLIVSNLPVNPAREAALSQAS